MPKIVSAVLHSATATEFFHRMAGDFEQISNADRVVFEELKGRHLFGVLVNLDETYCTHLDCDQMSRKQVAEAPVVVQAIRTRQLSTSLLNTARHPDQPSRVGPTGQLLRQRFPLA